MDQLGAVLRKNAILHKRMKCGTICECCCPTVLVLLVCAYSALMFHYIKTPDFSVVLPEISLDSLPDSSVRWTTIPRCASSDCGCRFGVAPDTPVTREFGARLNASLATGSSWRSRVAYLESREKAKRAMKEGMNEWMAVVSFEEGGLEKGASARARYSILFDGDRLPVAQRSSSVMMSLMGTMMINASSYVGSGYSAVQSLVERTLTGMMTEGASVRGSASLLPTRGPDFFSTLMHVAVAMMVPSAELIGACPFLCVCVIGLVVERVSRAREYYFILGLKKPLYWLSWFVTFSVPAMLTALFMVLVSCVFGVFAWYQFPVALAFYVLFFLSLILTSFLFQCFVPKPVLGAVLSIAWLYVPSQVFGFLPATKTAYTLVCAILSPFTFLVGVFKISAEGTMSNPPELARLLSMGELFGLMIGGCVIYGLLAWYFIEVSPAGDFGMSRPLWFPFMPSYWCPARSMSKRRLPTSQYGDLCSGPSFEPAGASQSLDNPNRGIRLGKITKVFSKGHVTAVDELSAALKPGKITALLGMNGCGKSTTVSMLVGLIPPTSGDALVEGRSVLTDMAEIRRSLGFCPQFDLLNPNLTAMEHMELVGRLRRMSGGAAHLRDEASRGLRDVGLADFDLAAGGKPGAKLVKAFSGGMKRKLSLAMALFGHPSCVLLDEPSSGVDAVSKRVIWDALLKAKTSCTILLVTHSMEEADALADTILVMSSGKLKASGSPMWLKEHFGTGYSLNVEKANDSVRGESLAEFVRERLPQPQQGEVAVCKESRNSASLRVSLACSPAFPALFRALEESSAKLGIASFGLSLTTLEDVFLHLSSGDAHKALTLANAPVSPDVSPVPSATTPSVSAHGEASLNNGENAALLECGKDNVPRASLLRQFAALMKMKSLFLIRKWRSSLAICLIPVLLLLLMVVPSKLMKVSVAPPDDTPVLHSLLQTHVDIPYAIVNATSGVSSTDLSELLRTVTSTSKVTFTQLPGPEELRKYAMNRGGFGHALVFKELSLQSKKIDAAFLYNDSVPESLPSLQSLLNTAFLRAVSKDPTVGPISYRIAVSDRTTQTMSFSSPSIYVVIGLVIGLCASASFVGQRQVAEQETLVKSQLYLAGLSPCVYVVTTWLVGVLALLVPLALSMIIVVCFKVTGLSGSLFPVFLLSSLGFVLALPAFNSCLARLFKSADSCTKWFMLLDLLIGVVPVGAKAMSGILGVIPHSLVSPISKILAAVCGFVPVSGLLYDLSVLSVFTPDSLRDAFSFSSHDVSLVTLVTFLSVAFWLAVSFVWELKQLTLRPAIRPSPAPDTAEDSDVAQERLRVQNGSADRDTLVLKSLHKIYPVGSKLAVRNISLGLPANECFGLLGPNGAGKSTVVSAVTGEIPITGGSIAINGEPMSGVKSTFFGKCGLGRCPQTDALLDYMTGREHLDLLCRVRSGFGAVEIRRQVDEALASVELDQWADRQTETYSGGTRRKLSVALSMLPGTRLIMLDECGTGVDPATRRMLWASINRQKSAGKSIVLTTHSMEEAEAVCTSVGIITSGYLACLGSVQHLKSKFASGYRVSFEVLQDATTTFATASSFSALDSFAATLLADVPDKQCLAVDQTDHRKTYQLSRIRSLADLFDRIESAKSGLKVTSYSVSQVALEEIFLDIVRRSEQALEIEERARFTKQTAQ